MLLIWLYRLVFLCLLPLVAAFLLYRLWKGKEKISRLKERFGLASKPRPAGKVVWVHCASVGESISVLPLVKKLVVGGMFVLVTSGTKTSAKVLAKKLPEISSEKTMHQFVPIDFWPFVVLFMRHWQPDVSVFVESEFWPELLHNAPNAVLINARISDKSFARYQKHPRFAKSLARKFTVALGQTAEDTRRLKAMGATHTKVGGNLKFDAEVTAPPQKVLDEWKQWQGQPVLVASSTHAGEEEQFTALYQTLKKQVKDLVMVVVPRHPERGPEIAKKMEEMGCMPELRSLQPVPEGGLYIANTIGELPLWYSLASVVVVGGSFVPHGGQNPLEAIKLGTYTLCGPHMFNFTEMLAQLQEKGLIWQVGDMAELERILPKLLVNPPKVDHTGLESLTGATELAFKQIMQKIS